MQVAGEQYHTLEAKCKEQLQLRATITAPTASVTCAQGNDGDQQGCLNSIQPSEALSNHMEAEAGVGSSTENHTAVVSIPVPPRSPILSPDVISGSPDFAEITSSPLLPSIEASQQPSGGDDLSLNLIQPVKTGSSCTTSAYTWILSCSGRPLVVHCSHFVACLG